MENGVLTYVNEAAYGELRDLITDIGIKDDTIEFTNLKALNKLAEQKVYVTIIIKYKDELVVLDQQGT